MRIISKFHDYYDTALGFGLDPERLYSRTPRHVSLDVQAGSGGAAILPRPPVNLWGEKDPVRSVTIGFCGRHYPVWIKAEWPFTVESLSSQRNERHWISLDEAIASITAIYRKHMWDRYYEKEDKPIVMRNMIQHDQRVREAPEDARIFRALDCPIYAMLASGGRYYSPVRTIEIITNPRLFNFGFERIVDAYSAFQTIATFLSNDLAKANDGPLTTGGDEVVARSKGFDEQSFRTSSPGQKKLNRRANRLRKRGSGT